MVLKSLMICFGTKFLKQYLLLFLIILVVAFISMGTSNNGDDYHFDEAHVSYATAALSCVFESSMASDRIMKQRLVLPEFYLGFRFFYQYQMVKGVDSAFVHIILLEMKICSLRPQYLSRACECVTS